MKKVQKNMKKTEKNSEKLKIIAKIEEFERKGMFDQKVEDSSFKGEINADKIDFLNQKLSSKIKTKFALHYGNKFYQNILKNKQYIFGEIEGLEKLEQVKGGAIITCNHFNTFDNLAVYFTLKEYFKKFNLYTVVKDDNYFSHGKIGFLMRNGNTFPIFESSSKVMTKCLNAVDTVLNRGDFVLIHPETSAWYNYRKPRPLKEGAYKLSAKNLVPIIPLFVTFEDTDFVDKDGFPVQKYTVHVEDIIYPDMSKTLKENAQIMRDKNFSMNKEIYEKVYKTKLEYLCEKEA